MTSDDEETDYLFGTAEPEAPSAPARILVSAGGGSSVRIIQDLDFSQDRVGTGFIDVFGAYVLPGAEGSLRHGVGLGLSLNLTGDGPSHDLGIDGGNQLVLAPYYLAYLRFGMDIVLGGKVGVPFALAPGLAPGVELALSFSYFLTAGFGLYVEPSASIWWGSAGTLHPIASIEGGVMIDYEVLP